MSRVWISKATFDELWALTHNIVVRMSATVMTPAVRVSKSRINIDLPVTNASTADYSGFFRLTLDTDEENTVTVADGSGTLGADNCGVFISGIDKIMVPVETLAVQGESYIVFEAVYADEEWTVEIKTETSFPEFKADKFTALLGVVKWNNETDAIKEIVQIWNNGIIYNNRYS